jgi:nucleoside-diphosphate-sugar epimerase
VGRLDEAALALGVGATVSPEEGLRRTIEWYRKYFDQLRAYFGYAPARCPP